MTIEASIVCDSVSPAGNRITTFKLRYPKFIHGEFMTHRVISRNASSSRAIPTAKLIEEVRSDALRAAPVFWGKNQAGMQAVEELSRFVPEPPEGRNTADNSYHVLAPYEAARALWEYAALDAAKHAEMMNGIGAHKQIVNRLLEPFSHINVVATATEWDNFFGLRLHIDAQPEIRALALAMWTALELSRPIALHNGMWHLPFVTVDDVVAIAFDPDSGSLTKDEASMRYKTFPFVYWGNPTKEKAIKVSVARCARVSYESFETGKRSTVEEDLELYDRLTAGLRDPNQPLHASPMEHQATPDYEEDGSEAVGFQDWEYPHEHGNFVGWRQYRKMLPNEAVAPLPKEYAK